MTFTRRIMFFIFQFMIQTLSFKLFTFRTIKVFFIQTNHMVGYTVAVLISFIIWLFGVILFICFIPWVIKVIGFINGSWFWRMRRGCRGPWSKVGLNSRKSWSLSRVCENIADAEAVPCLCKKAQKLWVERRAKCETIPIND